MTTPAYRTTVAAAKRDGLKVIACPSCDRLSLIESDHGGRCAACGHEVSQVEYRTLVNKWLGEVARCLRWHRPVYTRVCAYCGTEFTADHWRARTCSASCRQRLYLREKAERAAAEKISTVSQPL